MCAAAPLYLWVELEWEIRLGTWCSVDPCMELINMAAFLVDGMAGPVRSTVQPPTIYVSARRFYEIGAGYLTSCKFLF